MKRVEVSGRGPTGGAIAAGAWRMLSWEEEVTADDASDGGGGGAGGGMW